MRVRFPSTNLLEAQWVEQQTERLPVAGSNPAQTTNLKRWLLTRKRILKTGNPRAIFDALNTTLEEVHIVQEWQAK